jgi:hypothetical protein
LYYKIYRRRNQQLVGWKKAYFDESSFSRGHPGDRQYEQVFRPADAQIIAERAEDFG